MEGDGGEHWKTVHRSWKDGLNNMMRKCRVPKRLFVFFIVICFIVFYAIFNQEVLSVSDELVDLQLNVDIMKSFKSHSLVIINPASEDIPEFEKNKVHLTIENKDDKTFKSFSTSRGNGNLRSGRGKNGKTAKVEETSTLQPTDLVIEGTLSQIIPQMVEDETLPENVYSSYQLKYPAFVLSPPFTFEKNYKNTLPSISSFYQELVSHKRDDCEKEDICVHPSKYVHLYTNYTSLDPVSQNNRDYIVFFQDQYTIGHIDVFQHSVIPLTFSCISYSSRNAIPSIASNRIVKQSGNVVYLLHSQGGSFYRFIHSILPKLVQLESFLSDRSLSYLVDLSSQYPLVKELYLRLGIKEDQLIDSREIKQQGDSIQADRIIFTCNAPSLHPYLLQRAQYLLRLPHLQHPLEFPPTKLLYLSRRKGTLTAGRRVSNEQEVERYLQRFAKEKGLEFVSFYHTEYNSLQKTMELWSSAAIVVGPHGGAFANIAFAPKGTLVVEFLPNGSIFHSPAFKEHLSTYQQAMALGHRYYPIMSTYVKNDDMVVNVRDVLSTLEKALGKEKKHLKQ